MTVTRLPLNLCGERQQPRVYHFIWLERCDRHAFAESGDWLERCDRHACVAFVG